MALLGYLPKLKRGLGIASGTHFLHDFPIKMFLTQYSINGQRFNVIFFHFFLKIPNKMLLGYLDSWWRHKLWDLSSINLYSNGWQGEKKRKMEIQKFEYPENEKSFSDEIKSTLHSLWRAIIWWEIKIW